MAYIGRIHQKSWNYDPNADDFNARVGKILAQGHDLQSSLRSKALDDVKQSRAFEIAEKHSREHTPSSGADVGALINQTGQAKPKPVRTDGYVWVDPKGTYKGPVINPDSPSGTQRSGFGATGGSNGGGSPSGTGRIGPPPTASQQLYMGLDSTQRSMHMWRRVNAGCVESTTRMPVSTFTDHFADKSEQAEVPDKTQHFKKTDFSAYTEVKVRLMNHIKGNH